MKPKNKGGRPSKYKEEYCQMLIDHMASGLSFESFAAVIDVNDDTLSEWAKVHPKFSDAKKTAFSKSLLFWEKLGLNNIHNVSLPNKGSKSLNSTIWIFTMKNRFGWRDKKEIIDNNPDRNKVVFILPKEEQLEDQNIKDVVDAKKSDK